MKIERQHKTRQSHLCLQLEAPRDLPWKCPKCRLEMESAFLGTVCVELCPLCSGVFLDAGELEKIAQSKRKTTYAEKPMPLVPHSK
jgi:hypothetical protein